MAMIEGFIESQGVKIHYLANQFDNAKKGCLVFVPGIMMPGWIWQKQLNYFSKDYNVVAIDPRSQGDSEQSSEGHYAFSMAKDIQAVVEALHMQSLVLVGWSVGVPQVVNYAACFKSSKLVGIVLVDGIVGIDSGLSFYQSMIDGWMQFQMDRVPNTAKFIKIIFKQPQQSAYLAKLNEVAMRTPTNTVMTLIDNYMFQDFRPLLKCIQIPTWIATIKGPRLDYMRKMHDLLPNAHLEIFPEAGHALFVDKPDEFNRSLEAFVHKLYLEPT